MLTTLHAHGDAREVIAASKSMRISVRLNAGVDDADTHSALSLDVDGELAAGRVWSVAGSSLVF